ncbi:MAG: hypothetical protein H3C36_01210 [Chitinophagaceae bacterium]|nr:hypothetical protein [Chitinophagaceae bacterium]MCW5915049.1 hypothetical protein [Chitinophagaceae bacterium]MCZ2396680.1 hypothetical protein [Chitinophagales bacterium]
MRNLSFTALICLLSPVLLFGQRVDTKKSPTGKPVIINTIAGQKTIQPPFAYQGSTLRTRPQNKPVTRNKKVKKQVPPKGNFTKEMIRVDMKTTSGTNLRGTKLTRELPVYYPKSESGISQQMKRAWDYETITLTNQGDIDNFSTLYPGCTSVGLLTIDGSVINNLSTLSALESAGTIIVKNTSLTSLASLTSLTSITDSLVIDNNSLLTSVGLSNVATLGGLTLRDLPLLTTLDAFSSSLTDIANDVLVSNSAVTSLAGLSTVENIGGDLKVLNSSVITPGLTSLTSVGGYVWYDNNSQMTDLGLAPLTNMVGLLLNNLPQITSLGSSTSGLSNGNIATLWLAGMPQLTDITYVEQFTSVANIIFMNCDALTNMDAFQNITSAPYGILVYSNDALQSISGLSQITTVAYDKIEISSNDNLTSLNGLQNILETDALWITDNAALTSLTMLNSSLQINNVNGDDLQILYNSQLSVCNVPAICNYLNSGNAVNPQVDGNAGDCYDFISLSNSCGTSSDCTVKTIIVWNGSVSDEWSDPQNWTPNQVPDECSMVIIDTPNDYEPNVNDNITIGGLRMSSASLYMNGYNLTVSDTFNLYDSYIEGLDQLHVLNPISPRIFYSSIDSYGEIRISNFTGQAQIITNTFSGTTYISDHISRAADAYTIGNSFYGNLTFTNNSPYGSNYLANGAAAEDYINGDLTIINTATGTIAIGIGDGEPLVVDGHVTINQAYPGNVYLDKITFTGSNFQQLTVPPAGGGLQRGPIEIGPYQIKNIFFRKDGGYLALQQDIMVTEQLVMGDGNGIFGSQQTAMLVIGNGASVVDEDPVSGTFVEGPMKKIGNTAFTFPLGKTVGMMGFNGKQPNQSNSFAQRELYGDFKAPLSISAPAEATAEFVAEYKRGNPTNDGYDLSQKEAGLDGILPDAYWNLTRTNGASSDVQVSLTYDRNHYETVFDHTSLNITGWDGSKWISHPKGGTTGDNDRGTVSTASAITTYGPLAFYAQDIRTPILTIQPLADTVICKGSSFKVHFSLDTAALEGTIFKVEMSDENGDFSSPLIVASKTTFVSDSIVVSIPSAWLTAGNHHLLRMTGDRQAIMSQNTIGFTVADKPQVTVSVIGDAEVCLNTGAIKYYPSEKEEGVTYNWSVTGGTFTTDNDTAYVTFTASGNRTVQVTPVNNCGNGTVASKTVLVKPGASATAPVLTNTGRWIYASAPPPADQVTAINWYKDGSLIAGETGLSYYASEAGTFTVEYINDCGSGPVSNSIVFENASIPQTITFNNLVDKSFGDAPFELGAVASSGLPVQYQIVSGHGNITAGVFTITQIGTVTIRAWQPGDNDYDTAAYVTQTFTITKGNQTITFEPMEDVIFTGSSNYITLAGNASSGLPVTYSIDAANATISGKYITITGVGTVKITASQAGNANYNAAASVEQTFCVRADKLGPITGATSICPGIEMVYKTKKLNGLTYSWRLSDGTTFASDKDTVAINWPVQGTYKLYVSAVGPCGPETTIDSLTITVLDGVTAPDAVQNMLPASGITDQKLPLFLSWVPGNNTMAYDLYVWKTGTSRPANPIAANRTLINYTLTTQSGLEYDVDYNWQLVSKNGCLQTPGSIQTFRLRKAPDLVVTQVNIPASANSGQTITINWTVKNEGTGNTITEEKWNDAVFLSFDTIPLFQIATATTAAFNALAFPIRPLLIGTKPNVSALNVGQEYQNSIDFTLPLDYSDSLYVYVITNYKGLASAPPDADHSNDTARAANPIHITMSPTPDLRVDTVQAPATVFSGSTVNVSYKVTNYGALASGTWNDKIYVSKSPLFDKNSAILLKFPKANGSYYPHTNLPNNGNAFVKINENIETDDFYTRNVEVIIPNFISGTWFVHVVANEDKILYEGALAGNNENNRPIQIMLTPTPQFSLGTINTSATQVTPSQQVTVNWAVTNVGFYDNWEKNKAVYRQNLGICGGVVVGGSGGGSYGSVEPYFNMKHTTSYGASYWVDKVYLSTDPSGLNIGSAIYLGMARHGIEGVGLLSENDPPKLLHDTTFCTPYTYSYPYSQYVLNPGSVHPANFNWTVSSSLPQGNYYIYIVSNADKHVFTYIDTPVVRRSGMITVSYPDLTVPTVSVPASVRGGTPFNIDYTITNTSSVDVNDLARTDKIYIGDNPVFDGTATEVKSSSFKESIPAGESASHTVSVTLPNSTAGTKYIFVKTNSDNPFPESNTGNNTSAGMATTVSTALPMDLMADGLSIDGSAKVPGPITLQYTVRNVGGNNLSDTMVDKIYISCNPVFSESTAIEIGSWSGYRSITVGSEVNVTVNVSISQYLYLLDGCFPKADVNNAYFFVRINATESIYEPGNMANNIAGTGAKSVENRNANIAIAKVTGDESAKVGRIFNLQWDVINNGSGATLRAGWYVSRTDAVYFSKDSVVNEEAILLKEITYREDVLSGATLSKSLTVNMPDIEEGDYYVYVFTDQYSVYLNEIDRSNNFNFVRDATGKAKLIHVESTMLPDLTGEIISAPQRVAIGQPFTVKYKVTNVGVGSTYPEKWWDRVLVSVNTGSSGTVSSWPVYHTGVLNVGENYTDSVTVTLPLYFQPGNYLLLASPDHNTVVTESDENNNISGISIEAYLPEPADLTVQNITAPDTAYLGYPLDTIQWTIKNQSAASALGISTDGVYLSQNSTYDSTALLIGSLQRWLNLDPAAQKEFSMTPVIDNVPEGYYNIIVRSDIKNNIYESDKDNNENVKAKPVYVSVKQLQMDVPLVDTMTNSRFYKLLVPDSLKGSTILITLKSKDSLTQQNEVYVGGGYVPSVLKSDYKFNTPNYGNQEVLLTDVTDSVYYIAVRSVSIPRVQQDITLSAAVLPFAILNVQSDRGGNGGNVTVKLTGSLFTDSMTARLSNGATTIPASRVYFINSTQVYATFPLTGKPIGVYDVKLIKTDNSEAGLASGFSVVTPDNGGLYSGGGVNTGQTGSGSDPGCDPGMLAGMNSQLSVELVVPDRVFVGLIFPIIINYSNPTNMDIPVQTMVLYNDFGIPMSFTREGIQDGTSSLYIELTGKDGPPGIFRAGSSGSITIYTNTPPNTPPHEFIHFNLK